MPKCTMGVIPCRLLMYIVGGVKVKGMGMGDACSISTSGLQGGYSRSPRDVI